jgi:hypothetical protein
MALLGSRARTVWSAVALAGVCLAGAGCTQKVIAAAPAPVPLSVPSVPPRIVGPVVVPEEKPQPVAEAPAAQPQRPAPRPPRLNPRPAENAAEPVEDPQRARADGAEPAATPAPLLRNRETANDAEAAQKVRDSLNRAEQNLAKVNLRALTANGRAEVDTARRMIVQASEALEKRKLVFALSLADKAEALSISLANR